MFVVKSLGPTHWWSRGSKSWEDHFPLVPTFVPSITETLFYTFTFCMSVKFRRMQLLMELRLRAAGRHLQVASDTPCLNPSQTGRYSIYRPPRDGRLSWLCVNCSLFQVSAYNLYSRSS